MIYYTISKQIILIFFLSIFIFSPGKILADIDESSAAEVFEESEKEDPTQQRIKDFYLTNYKEDGIQDWEVKGKEAFIYDEYVDIAKMDAKYYGEEDTVTVKSEKAKLNKKNMDVYLQEDVQVENKEGMKLVTDSLDWKREQNQIKTDDWVTVNKESMQIVAKGLDADTALKTVDFEENVEVTLPDDNNKDFTLITCDGPLEIEHALGTATFNNNVMVENKDGKLFSDIATAFFDADAKKIIKIISTGNVKIIKDDNVTLAQKATYYGEGQRMVLEGSPRVIYFPTKEENETSGN
jgi:LPS export ABC transporter protein LptC